MNSDNNENNGRKSPSGQERKWVSGDVNRAKVFLRDLRFEKLMGSKVNKIFSTLGKDFNFAEEFNTYHDKHKQVPVMHIKGLAHVHPVFLLEIHDPIEKKLLHQMVLKGETSNGHLLITQDKSFVDCISKDSCIINNFMMHCVLEKTPGVGKLTGKEFELVCNVPKENFDSLFSYEFFHRQDIQKRVWVKMPLVEHLYDFDGVLKNSQPHNPTLFVEKMKARDGVALYELGQICAVDLFIGNTDRLNEKGGVSNPGNVMFILDKESCIHMMALDTYDPNSEFSVHTPKVNEKWLGLMLLSKEAMHKFAHAVLISDKWSFNGCLTNAKCGAKFDEKCVEIFVDGMCSAVSEMHEKLFDLIVIKKIKCSPGMLERVKKLHWDKAPLREELIFEGDGNNEKQLLRTTMKDTTGVSNTNQVRRLSTEGNNTNRRNSTEGNNTNDLKRLSNEKK